MLRRAPDQYALHAGTTDVTPFGFASCRAAEATPVDGVLRRGGLTQTCQVQFATLVIDPSAVGRSTECRLVFAKSF